MLSTDATQIADEEFKLTTYEYLYAGDKAEGDIIAEHAGNMSDEEKVAQTVTIKNIALATTANGVDGKSEIAKDAKTVVIDKVEYKDAIIGQTYTISGTLMDKKTGAPVGLPGTTASTTFVADKANGIAEIRFELARLFRHFSCFRKSARLLRHFLCFRNRLQVL